MRFVCSTFGSSGDVFPMLGLAIELQSRGHEVCFATNEHFAKLVQQNGISFISLGAEEDYQACIRNPDLWHPRRSFKHLFETLKPALLGQYEILEEQSRRASIVSITNCFGFGALLAQDKLKIPTVTMHLQPAVLWSDRSPPALAGVVGPNWMRRLLFRIGERFFIDPVVCPFVNRWRKELGLPPIQKVMRWWNSTYAVLCTFPDWYAPPALDWPPQIIQTDFPLWNSASSQPLPEEVNKFLDRGEAPIVFTPGTANIHGRAFFETAVATCQRLQRRAILLTSYPEQIPRDLPSSIAYFAYVPLDLLLPRAKAFVHHGGIGSTSQAMLAGIPQVLMPLAHDQFDNAQRVRTLGIGDSIPANRFSRERLSKLLCRLFNEPEFASNCQTIAKRLTARNGLKRSAWAIEKRLTQ
jgi:rhamnosyltransferase subunit B